MSSAPQLPPTPDPAIAPEPLPFAMLLAATGGLLDAVVYLRHGHVFATALTGNTVLLGLSALSGRWAEFVRHLVPIAGYLAGVVLSKFTRAHLGRRAAPLGLALEAAALAIAGWLPNRLPAMLFTAGIALVAALQVSDFRHVGPYSYNSTFVTGNFRDLTEAFYDFLSPRSNPETQEQGRLKARTLAAVILSFLAGAIAGAFAAVHLGDYALWLPIPVLLGLLLFTLTQPGASPASNFA